MANGKATLSGISATLDKAVKKIKQLKIVKLIQSEDRVIVTAVATGSLFLLLAVIQLVIIAFGKVHVYFDNVLLIVTDFVVAAISAVIALRQASKWGKIRLPRLWGKRQPKAKTAATHTKKE